MSKTLPPDGSAARIVADRFADPLVESQIANSALLLRRQALATQLDCSLRTIDNLQAKGMPCVLIGRSRRFILSEVSAWLKRRGGRS